MNHQSVRNQLVSRIGAEAKKRVDADVLDLFCSYVENLLHVHPDESMLAWADEALWALHWGLFRATRELPGLEPMVKVFNPDVDADGWVSDRTLIYFCHQDVPFLVDSLRLALNRQRLNIHQFESSPMEVLRDEHGSLKALCAADNKGVREDHGFILVDALTGREEHKRIENEIRTTLIHVSRVVSDFEPMLARIDKVIDEYRGLDRPEDAENILFLQWLRDGNFTFLGVADFRLADASEDPLMVEDSADRLGLMALRPALEPARLSELNRGFADFYRGDEDIAYAKSRQRSSVHCDTYPDYVVIKRRDDSGRVIGETRFLGLYTARLYHLSVEQIPLVRTKVQWLIKNSGLDPRSHNGKAYIAILEGHPRDELIQAPLADLLATTLGIWKIYERRTVRLFARTGAFQKFVSCIVYLPRESLRTEIRERIEQRLSRAFMAESSEYTTQFLAESLLARVHFIFRLTPGQEPTPDLSELEQAIVHIVHD